MSRVAKSLKQIQSLAACDKLVVLVSNDKLVIVTRLLEPGVHILGINTGKSVACIVGNTEEGIRVPTGLFHVRLRIVQSQFTAYKPFR